jgi:hypothetical protein
MTQQLLLKLVQISDLHIGRIDAQGDPLIPDAVIKDWWRYSQLFQGLLGHTYRAMAQLEEFYLDRVAEGLTRLVITGDLTTCGADIEFETARAFLTGGAVLSRERTVGLRAEGAFELAIPGNHDHWPGAPTLVGDPSNSLWDLFPQRPMTPCIIDLTEQHRLVVLGINTDEDVHPTGPSRVYARGRFASQLDALDRQIEAHERRKGDILVLAMHHSRMHGLFKLGLTASTRKRLSETLESAQIAVILSGHTHEPAIRIERIAGRSSSWELLEARCGTTTQLDDPKVLAARGITAALIPNNILVHEIVSTEGRIEWRTVSFNRTDRGFQEGKALPGSRPIVIG